MGRQGWLPADAGLHTEKFLNLLFPIHSLYKFLFSTVLLLLLHCISLITNHIFFFHHHLHLLPEIYSSLPLYITFLPIKLGLINNSPYHLRYLSKSM
jgi:hypothetical protein